MAGEVILVFGISGVGKTQSCLAFVERHPEHLYIRAGELLKSATHEEGEALRTAPADRIRKNQERLRDALWARRKGCWDSPVIIDAHSVIDNDHELVKVPVDVIAQLQPSGLILLEAPANVVASRRTRDQRQRPHRSLDELRRECAVAREAVTEYSRTLNLPLEVGTVNEDFRLDDVVDSVKRQIDQSHR